MLNFGRKRWRKKERKGEKWREGKISCREKRMMKRKDRYRVVLIARTAREGRKYLHKDTFNEYDVALGQYSF